MRRMRPAWMIQRPDFFQLSSSRLPWAATRLTARTRPTRAPPGRSGIIQSVPGTSHQTRKLVMYLLTAPKVPSSTWASVQRTTRTIRSARQGMVSLREVMASQARMWRGLVKAQRLQEVDEVRPGRSDGIGVANHLDEPAIPACRERSGDHARLHRALAREVVDRDRARRGLDRLARRGERGLADGSEADL